jgi:hypothetical protein
MNALGICKRALKAVKRGDRPSEPLMGQILQWLANSEAKEALWDAQLAAQAQAISPAPAGARNLNSEVDRLTKEVADLRIELALK